MKIKMIGLKKAKWRMKENFKERNVTNINNKKEKNPIPNKLLTNFFY